MKLYQLCQFQKSVTFKIGFAIACVCSANAAPNRGFKVALSKLARFERALIVIVLNYDKRIALRNNILNFLGSRACSKRLMDHSSFFCPCCWSVAHTW